MMSEGARASRLTEPIPSADSGDSRWSDDASNQDTVGREGGRRERVRERERERDPIQKVWMELDIKTVREPIAGQEEAKNIPKGSNKNKKKTFGPE